MVYTMLSIKYRVLVKTMIAGRKTSAVGLSLAIALLLGCSEDKPSQKTAPNEPSSTQKILDELDHQVRRAQEQFNELAPDKEEVKTKANEELEKLFSLEYRVVDLPLTASATAWADTLNILGRDRWECESPQSVSEAVRVICRRRPKSYLRGVGRLVGAF